MKTLAVIFISFILITGCGKKTENVNSTVDKHNVSLSQEKYDSLCFESQRAVYLKNELRQQFAFIDYLKKSPEFFLIVLDQELNSVEKGIETYGSYSDFFVPTLLEGLEAGVPKKEIWKRIDRCIFLAKKGLFISSEEERLYNSGGAKAILDDITEGKISR